MIKRNDICEIVNRLAVRDGATQTVINGVKLFKLTQSCPRSPMLYNPSIVIVLQGKKIGYVSNQSHCYDPERYLVMSLPVPFECEAFADSYEPYLALSLDIDMVMLSNLLIDMDGYAEEVEATSTGVHSAMITPLMENAVMRLVQVLDASPQDARILGPHIVHEIVYYVLSGPQGAGLRAIASGHSRFSKIARILRRIHADCTVDVEVESLARELNMSLSSFHQNFKAITSTSPIQYVKSVRLHKARMLMTHEGLSASTASARVGYMSASQFNREFKRFFGTTPAEEKGRMRKPPVAVNS